LIAENKLQGQVTCIVNFYGVPLRIPGRTNDAALREELVSLRKQQNEAQKQAQPMVEAIERLALQVDATYAPAVVGGLDSAEALPRHAEKAASFVASRLAQMPAGEKRDDLEKQFKSLAEQFRAPVNITEPGTAPVPSQPATSQAITPEQLEAKMTELSLRRGDAEGRRAFRDFLREHGGILVFLQVLAGQEQYLTPDDSEAAVDNELALMWWGLYPRFRWQPNPLNYKYSDTPHRPVMMVMRLDASRPDLVHAMIDTSIKVEHEGLKGRIVLDSRGLPPQKLDGKTDVMGVYDQTIRNLEVLIHTHTKLPLLIDDRPNLIPPGAVKDCAIYCGWYSPREYVPSVSFVPGAVALHIASYEMETLHGATRGWCRNLLDAGAVATLGPEAEPFLHAFPAADEFFPVLLTGKVTLAETYWATNPLVSWRITMVGDPLYTPFKTNPALKPEDLPARMRGIFANSSTAPSDR
jgi:uncharacterized protein (TIGR03790 family)